MYENVFMIMNHALLSLQRYIFYFVYLLARRLVGNPTKCTLLGVEFLLAWAGINGILHGVGIASCLAVRPMYLRILALGCKASKCTTSSRSCAAVSPLPMSVSRYLCHLPCTRHLIYSPPELSSSILLSPFFFPLKIARTL